jgi:DNA-binding IclR family transcriptional regulator
MSGFYRAIVLKALFEHPAGLTVDEVCAAADYPRYSLQPRFSELLKKGLIRDTGRRRRNRSGALAAVWRATALDEAEGSI